MIAAEPRSRIAEQADATSIGGRPAARENQINERNEK
jgi:hypothetical protein